jgi:hypothetical protein
VSWCCECHTDWIKSLPLSVPLERLQRHPTLPISAIENIAIFRDANMFYVPVLRNGWACTWLITFSGSNVTIKNPSPSFINKVPFNCCCLLSYHRRRRAQILGCRLQYSLFWCLNVMSSWNLMLKCVRVCMGDRIMVGFRQSTQFGDIMGLSEATPAIIKPESAFRIFLPQGIFS